MHRIADNISLVLRLRRYRRCSGNITRDGKVNRLKCAGIVGFIIAVILLAEHLEGIAARLKINGYDDTCCTAFAVPSNISVVKDSIAAVAKQDGNIFVVACLRTRISNLYVVARRCGNTCLPVHIG